MRNFPRGLCTVTTSATRLARTAGAHLRRLDVQRNGLVRHDQPSRENRDSVFASLIIERFSEPCAHSGETCELRNLIDIAGALCIAVDLLQQDDVGIR